MSPDTTSARSRLVPWLLALAGVGVLAWNVRRGWGFFADDALISLRYAARLLDGHGLTWNDGERVEGYSDLLWVLLVSIPGALGVDLVRAAIGLGLACAAGIVLLVQRAQRPVGTWGQLAGVLLVALSGPLGAWAQAGLEGPLVALLVLGAVERLLPVAVGETEGRRLVHAGLLLGLACWARPDTPVLVAGLAAGVWLATGQDLAALRRAAVVALVPAAFVVTQVAFRLAYYGDWLPNTAYAKLDVASLDRAELGVLYVLPWLRAGGWLWGLALVGLLAPPRAARNAGRLLLPVIGLWVAYVVRVGGDHFAAWRLLLVVDPLRALLAATGIAAVVARFGRGRLAPVIALPLVGVLAAWHDRAQERQSTIQLVRTEKRWVRDAEPAGRLLRAAFAPLDPLLATCAAGGLPYWSGLRALDPLGLTDRHIAHHSFTPGRVGIPGHEAGDTAYVLSRAPDIVVICSPGGGDVACLPQEAALLATPELRARYALRWMRGTDPYAFTFGPLVRVDSARLGVEVGADRIRLPGWLWADDRAHPAELDDRGRLVVRRKGGETARLPNAPVTGTGWVPAVESEPADATADVTLLEGGTIEVRFDADATLVAVSFTRSAEAAP